MVWVHSTHYTVDIYTIAARSRTLCLCGEHGVNREALYQQAGKAKGPASQGLVQDLQEMEKNRPEEFLEHLENFSQEYLS